MRKVVITTTTFGEYDKSPLNLLEDSGFEVLLNPHGRKLKKEELLELCRYTIGIIAGTEVYDADVLKILTQPSALSPQPCLKVISRCGTGIDNIDLEVAERFGIKVFNTTDGPTLPVAELTVSLMLDLLRHVTLMDHEIRNGIWKKRMGNLLNGKRVGIVGFGRIGQKVAELLLSFGCEVRYYDIRTVATEIKAERLDLHELLKTSNIVSVHVSSKWQLIGKNEIGELREGAWLVNMSRGGVIDETALYEALKDGRLSGAALDVFEQEPYNGPLRELNNCILTPHIGSYAREARVEMEMQAVRNLLHGIKGS